MLWRSSSVVRKLQHARQHALRRDDVVDLDALGEATAAGINVAAAACTVQGANLPDGFA
jgi:hypothetical protein